jgi:16S rRNA (uracil1498-N3)-methyltransferase
MTRHRFYVPRDLIREDTATLPPGQAHHLRDVLRIRSGDVVEIFDGAGSGYSGEVELRGSEVIIRGLVSLSCPESPFHVTLAAALIKSAKFEWVLEKSTELGVDAIIPLNTRLSDIRIPADRMPNRLDRWNRILSQSARQCKRFAAPRLRAPLDFSDFLAADNFSGWAKILFYEKAAEPWQPDNFVSDHIVLCVGPEGGWDHPEVEQAREAGYKIYGLGPRILRAETAAIAALSIIQHHIHILRSRQPEDRNQ